MHLETDPNKVKPINLGYHFTKDGSPIPPVGKWLEHTGDVVLCGAGLHFSRDPFDALSYAPGNLLHLVEGDDIVEEDESKGVCRRRKIVASINAENLLRECARKWALDVIDKWDAPDVVVKWLKTGDESLRSAAYSAADSATASAAYSAAYSAAFSAAYSAARESQRKHFAEKVNEAFKGEQQ